MRKRNKTKQVPQIEEPSLFSAEEMAEMLAVKPETVNIPSTKTTQQHHEPRLSDATPKIEGENTNNGLLSGNKSDLLPNNSDGTDSERIEDVSSEEEQSSFIKVSDDDGVNRIVDDMVMAMGLLDAYYTPSQTRLIAMESAALAQNGINAGKIYELPAIRGRRFDGNQLTAIYYVSFARSFPSMIDRINLPLSEAYEAALEKYKK